MSLRTWRDSLTEVVEEVIRDRGPQSIKSLGRTSRLSSTQASRRKFRRGLKPQTPCEIEKYLRKLSDLATDPFWSYTIKSLTAKSTFYVPPRLQNSIKNRTIAPLAGVEHGMALVRMA